MFLTFPKTDFLLGMITNFSSCFILLDVLCRTWWLGRWLEGVERLVDCSFSTFVLRLLMCLLPFFQHLKKEKKRIRSGLHGITGWGIPTLVSCRVCLSLEFCHPSFYSYRKFIFYASNCMSCKLAKHLALPFLFAIKMKFIQFHFFWFILMGPAPIPGYKFFLLHL